MWVRGSFEAHSLNIAKEKVCRYDSREIYGVSHQICAKSRRSIDSNKFVFLQTELVSDNVFAKIVSEGQSRIFKIRILAAYF